MCTTHYVNGPRSIDQTMQPSSVGGLLGNQKFSLISHTVKCLDTLNCGHGKNTTLNKKVLLIQHINHIQDIDIYTMQEEP